MIARFAGTAAAVIATVGLVAGCASSNSPAGSSSSQSSQSPTSSDTAAATQTFNGVTVKGATDLATKPEVTSSSTAKPTALQTKDFVVGTGTAATPTSMVTVQYVGVLLSNGKQFDASWDHGGATSFSLSGVVAGFTQGIGGTTGLAPMKVGGRRIMVLPAALGYGATGTQDGSIPPNAPIVFIVDLVAVT